MHSARCTAVARLLVVTLLVGTCDAQSHASIQGRCSVYGTLHVYTFDNKSTDYNAPCKYELVRPCTTFINNTFSLRIKNERTFPNVADSVVWVQYVEVLAEDRTIQVYRNGSVFVQGAAVDAYNFKCRIGVDRVGAGWQVSLGSAGINVLLTQAGGVTVTVPALYRGQLCGLCGDFDGNPDNDVDADSTKWLVGDSSTPVGSCMRDPRSTSACDQDSKVMGPMLLELGFCGAFDTAFENPFNRCLDSFSDLNASIFNTCKEDFCNNVISPANDSQVEDVSSGCPEDQCYVNNVTAKAAVCRLAEFLARECIARGRPPEYGWRESLDCLNSTLQCPSTSTYSPAIAAESSTPSCAALLCSALTTAASSGSSSISFGNSSVSGSDDGASDGDGCQCPENMAWLGGSCVAVRIGCGCLYGGSSLYKEGDQWINPTCSANITCKEGGQIAHSNISCAPNAVCVSSEGQGSCQCPAGYYGDGFARCTYACPPGQMTNGNNDGCMECPIGTYQNASAQSFCHPCPGDDLTLNTGSTSSNSCIEAVPLIPDSRAAITVQQGLDVVYSITVPDSALPLGVPFGDRPYRYITVGSNGIITFGKSYVGVNPTNLSQLINTPMVAAFWYRQDSRNGPPSLLTVSQYNPVATSSSTSYSTGAGSAAGSIQNVSEATARLQLIDRVLLRTGLVPTSYSSRWAVTATWSQFVSYPYPWYFNRKNGVFENATYQAVITTDGQTTYVLLLYPSNQISLSRTNTNRRIYMGYNDGNQGYTFYASGTTLMAQIATLPSNTGRPGVWLFSFSPRLRTSLEGRFCLQWYNDEAAQWAGFGGEQQQQQQQQQLTPCPCNLVQARSDPRFILNMTSLCAVSVTRNKLSYYQMCCYSRDLGSLLTTDQSGSKPIKYSPYRDPGHYLTSDQQPFYNCCVAANYCSLYRQCRPVGSCSNYQPPQAAAGFGDPHFVLLDSGTHYTYNPIGEFHLIRSSAIDVQVRMGFSNVSGIESMGTIILAVAAKSMAPVNSSRVHFEINPNGTDFIIYVQSPDCLVDNQYSSMFSVGAPDGTFAAFDGVAVYKSGSSLIASFDGGCTIVVSIKVTGLMDVTTYVPESYQNKSTYGLLGAYDGDLNNDLTLRNGSVVTCPVINNTYYDSECIYRTFGESWRIAQQESVFWYRPSLNSRLYTNLAFQPIFSIAYTNATAEVCGSDMSCAFDWSVSQRYDIANAARDAASQISYIKTTLASKPPAIDGPLVWKAYVGSPQTAVYNVAYQDSNDTFDLRILEEPSNCNITKESNNTFHVTWLPQAADLLSNRTLRLVAIGRSDSLSSAEFVVKILLCRHCGNGTCDHSILDAGGYIKPQYMIYACSCNPGWTGPDCTLPYEGCSMDGSSSCSASYCPATYQPASVIATHQTCSQTCDTGFISSLSLQNDSSVDEQVYCIDIDECVVNPSTCLNGTCVNTPGSYKCTCPSGYSPAGNGSQVCTDVDECALGIFWAAHCEQLCINTPGSYFCDCYTGFQLANGTGRCLQINQPGSACDKVNCSYACTNTTKDDGSWHCACPLGYEFQNQSQADSGSPCQGVDKCAPGGGSRCSGMAVCNSTQGGYYCSCPVGYSLSTDMITCTACPAGTYGIECAETCSCGDRAAVCDPVRGCTNCRSGWSGEQCQFDIDECTSSTWPCPANSNCTNKPGTYWCTCNPGFRPKTDGSGVNEYCSDVNECNAYSPCSLYAACNNTLGNYTCSCLPGYSGNGIMCNDINECLVAELSGQEACDPQAVCVNTIGSFMCSCAPGYYGDGLPDGQRCLDVDECESPSTCPVSLGLTCLNYPGTFVCTCADGYRRDTNGSSADRCLPDVCSDTYFGYCSDPHQECVNASGQYNCICMDGYSTSNGFTGNGSTCSDVDECSSTVMPVCSTLANCTNLPGSFACTCPSGYSGNGSLTGGCSDIDECLSSACPDPLHQACHNLSGSFQCICIEGYRMSEDADSVSVCVPDICDTYHNGSCPNDYQVCTNGAAGYRCDCSSGYTLNGTECVVTDKCLNGSFCKNQPHTVCINNKGSFSCVCETGYNAEPDGTCVVADACGSTDACPYANTRCINVGGSFSCPCADGYVQSNPAVVSGDCRMKDSDTSILVIQIFRLPGSTLSSMGNDLNKLLEDALTLLFKGSFAGFSGLRILNITKAKVSIDGGSGKGPVALAQLIPDTSVNVTYEVVYNKSSDGGQQMQNLLIQLRSSNGSLSLNGTTVYASTNIVYAAVNGSFIEATCTKSGCPDGYSCQADGSCNPSPSSGDSPSAIQNSTDFTPIWAAVGVAAGLLLAGLVACISVAICRRRQGSAILHREPRVYSQAPFMSGARRGPTLTHFSAPSSIMDSSSMVTDDSSSVISYENSTRGREDMSRSFFPRFPWGYPSRSSGASLSRRHSNTWSSGD